jgi:hypothetical protein
MHGLPYSTNVTRILALDLGKFTSVLCVYDPITHAHRFASAQTTPRTIHDLLVAHETADPAHPPGDRDLRRRRLGAPPRDGPGHARRRGQPRARGLALDAREAQDRRGRRAEARQACRTGETSTRVQVIRPTSANPMRSVRTRSSE